MPGFVALLVWCVFGFQARVSRGVAENQAESGFGGGLQERFSSLKDKPVEATFAVSAALSKGNL